MNPVVDLLNELFRTVYRSLPMYLKSAPPWSDPAHQAAREALDNIICDQQQTSQRIGEAILDRDGAVIPGDFPMVYTGINDVSIDYLLAHLFQQQHELVSDIEAIVAQLQQTPDGDARELAEETLGSERAHLETLESLIQPAAA